MPRDVTDGHVKIINELVDDLAAGNFNKREYKILWAVIRLTYGFNRKETVVSIYKLAKMTNLRRDHASKAVASLACRNVLNVEMVNRPAEGIAGNKRISINKYSEKWISTQNGDVHEIGTYPDQVKNVPKTGKNRTQNRAPIKDNKDSKDRGSPSFVDSSMWEDFLEHRRQIKKPMSAIAVTRLKNKLEKLKDDGFDPNKLLERSIVNGWQDVYTDESCKSKKRGVVV